MSVSSSRACASHGRDQEIPEATWTYADFAAQAESLLAPLAALMEPGTSALPITGPPSDHGDAADRFEAYARPCLLAALWLHSATHTRPADRSLDADAIAGWFREGLTLGTDPTSDQYWGVLPSFHQFAVEMAILVMALDIAADRLWEPLPPAVKQRVAEWLGQIRGHAGHHNNHLFFDLLVLEFLNDRGFGAAEDRACIDWLFAELETMYRGDGWFIDGTNENYDHYNAYAFHIYGLYWARRYGSQRPERAERWKAWAAAFLPDYARFFSARGEPVPFGRSLTYRFNGLGVFPLAADLGIESIDPGVARRICRKCIQFFVSRPIEQSQGCMSIGWTDEFEGIAEPYSCAGSPYWAAKGLLMLLLDPGHAFFTAEEKPIPAESDLPPTIIKAPGYVIRNIASHEGDPKATGDVELLNAGGWCSVSAAARFGQWKWGRIGYRTGAGSLYPEQPASIPPDAALTACEVGGATWFGRHKTIPIMVEHDHMATAYTLSAPKSGFGISVVTDLWWHGNSVLLLHRVRCMQQSLLRSGGFALHGTPHGEPGASAEDASTTDGLLMSAVANATQRSQCTALFGWTTPRRVVHAISEPRQHLYGPGALVPTLETELKPGQHLLAEIIWSGSASDAEPRWSSILAEKGEWVMTPSTGAEWRITHDRLPSLNAASAANG